MAKKKTVVKDGAKLPDPFASMQNIDEDVEILADSAYSNIKEWIPTGNYLLNACISGSLFGGVPSGRVTTLSGSAGTGKSYLATSICREAQKLGYSILYLDSEGAIDKDFVARLGCDPKRVAIRQVQTISETSQIIAKLCAQLDEEEATYGQHNKWVIVLDSLGNLTSDKERDDIMAGNQKRDMTKQQEIKAMFRVNATPLARNSVLFIVNSHVYSSMDMFKPGNVVSGGSGIAYNSSVTLELSTSKLVDKTNDEEAAKQVGKDDLTRTGVTVTAKPQKSRFTIARKIRFQIPYFKKPNPYVGLESYLTWENSGVVRGSLIDEKAYNKLSDAEKTKIYPFEYEGQTLYCQPKDSARGIVVKHLGRQVDFIKFFSDEVFTDAFLHELDENVIKPAFKLPDQSAYDDIKEIEDSIAMADAVAEEK